MGLPHDGSEFERRMLPITVPFPPPPINAPLYARAVFRPATLRVIVEEIARILREHYPQVGAVAGIGQSGQPVIGALSFATGLPMIAVRKTTDQNNHGQDVQGYVGDAPYAFIDDVIDTGKTLRTVVMRVGRIPEVAILYQAGAAPFGSCCKDERTVDGVEVPVVEMRSKIDYRITVDKTK